MPPAEHGGRRSHLLLVGDGLPSPAGPPGGNGNGWSVQRVSDGFAALERCVQDAAIETVLVDQEAFGVRSGALADAILASRPGVAVFLVCPAYLEPEARRLIADRPGLDPNLNYLVKPLSRPDWARLAPADPRSARPGPRPLAGQGDAGEPAQPISLGPLADVADQLHRPLGQFLAALADWAAQRLGCPVRVSFAKESAASPPSAANLSGGATITLAIATGGEAELAVADARADRGVCNEVSALAAALLAQHQRLAAFRQMAFTDPLSGAYNRRYLMQFLTQLLSRAERERFRVTLLLFDIDDFKLYNDQFGHPVGDRIIRNVTQLLRTCTRPHDVVARIGGDEFAVLFWDAGPPRQPGSNHPSAAQGVTDRFVEALRRHPFEDLGPEARGVLTISGGLASYPWDGRSADDLIGRADDGLRAAKASGKDRIYIVGRGPG